MCLFGGELHTVLNTVLTHNRDLVTDQLTLVPKGGLSRGDYSTVELG